MKILLQINTEVNYAAPGRIAEEIGQVAIQNGWKSYIGFGRYKNRKSSSSLIKIGTDSDILFHVIQTRFLDRHGFGSHLATVKLIEEIKIIRPSIIHLHNLHGYYINIDVLFKYLATSKIPIVWTLHDCWPITGHCTYFDFIKCDRWKTGCFSCPQVRSYPSSYLFDRSDKNYKTKRELFTSPVRMIIVPVSSWLKKIVEDSFLSRYPISVINNGIDLSLFKPVISNQIRLKYNLGDKFVILGVASIWSSRKGFSDFIQLSKLIDQNCIIMLVGLSKEKQLGLPANVIGISRTENINDLVELYSCANVFINPTYEDNFPTTNLESLSCGTPVITYRTGGSIESITLKTGFVIEKGDIKGLLNAISVIKNKGKENYVKECRTYAELHFNKDLQYKNYFKLYEGLINGR